MTRKWMLVWGLAAAAAFGAVGCSGDDSGRDTGDVTGDEGGADADGDADGDADADADGDADADVDACVPDCTSRECGLDPVCGGTCGPGCGASETCNADGHCIPTAGGTWVSIAAGTFQMGSPATEPDRYTNETQHSVTLTHRFEILSTEVTQAQFQERMDYNPSGLAACGGECPVEMVRWHEAAAYCNALSSTAGLANCYSCSGSGADVTCDLSMSYPNPYACPGYRLPTEAEWEYAARAGTTGGTYNGTCDDTHLSCEQPNAVLDSIAWFCGNSGATTHPVATRDPNAWGLYDMLGNVYEWCHDWWDGADYPAGSATDPWGLATGSLRVYRGGSWSRDAGHARAAYRDADGPADRGSRLGFRPSRSLP